MRNISEVFCNLWNNDGFLFGKWLAAERTKWVTEGVEQLGMRNMLLRIHSEALEISLCGLCFVLKPWLFRCRNFLNFPWNSLTTGVIHQFSYLSVFKISAIFTINIKHLKDLISGFRRDVDEICGLLGYYAASCGNCLPTFGTDKLSRNVGKHHTTPRNTPEDRRFNLKYNICYVLFLIFFVITMFVRMQITTLESNYLEAR
jgi:hypothetical protein